ncbi:MAG TPA: MmcQ/YjbR family DNA-binding protein [Pyrinomonadaceae bacterium]|nr:MmcQ/YjbR family DNA-binding protein [Pyrinomonadaceae bacterium]
MKSSKGEKHLLRVRRICSALPETMEKLSHGEPTFFARKKVFAMFSNNHHNDGHIAVMIPAAIGIQAMLIESSPDKFYRPPYVGVRGWVGIELERVNDEELAFHIHEAWRLIAPKSLQETIELSQSKGRSGRKTGKEQTTKWFGSGSKAKK